MQFVLEKIKFWEGVQSEAYLEGFKPTHALKDMKTRNGTEIKIAGRIVAKRELGKVSFIKLYDIEGEFQLLLTPESLKNCGEIMKNIDLGDHIGARGFTILSKTSEPSLQVEELFMLSKAHCLLPTKYGEIADEEILTRQPYLACLLNPEFRNNMIKRLKIRKTIHKIMEKNGFIEVETPILQNVASGAAASPFKTRYNALDQDFYLRIAPELYLKTMMLGGFTKIYEMGKCFRNEGIDNSHLQEFTMMECYSAYWTYQDHILLAKELIIEMVKTVSEDIKINVGDGVVDFSKEWEEVDFKDWIYQKTKIDIMTASEKELMLYIQEKQLSNKDIILENKQQMIELIYKKACCVPQLQPIIVKKYPSASVPLAKTDLSGQLALKFQLIIAGIEVVNSYSELIDPIKQEANFKKQESTFSQKEQGEYVRTDEKYLNDMRYGLMPMAGMGMGIDRIVQLLCGIKNIRRAVFFSAHKNKN